MYIKRIILKIIIINFIGFHLFDVKKLNAIIPFYNLPSQKTLKKNSLEIGKTAYQLLYIGQIEESLKLAKLAISLNEKDENLWALLTEAQIANNLLDEALRSIKEGKKINGQIAELYFSESSIFLKQNKISNAKNSLIIGLKLKPKNFTAIFQLGNIFLMEKNYSKALENFDKALKINSTFWQAINNKGLIFFELDKKSLAIEKFKKAISIENNAESTLALAVALQNQNRQESIILAKQALMKNPNYVTYEYREEQLWGIKLQNETENLFKLKELKDDIALAKLYIK